MNNQPVQQLSSYKLVFFSTTLLLACVSLSSVLMKSGLNQAWMLSIHAAPILPTWVWSFINIGGDAWVVLLILLLAERRPGEITSWVLKTWLTGAVLVQFFKIFFPMPRPANVLGKEMLSLIDHPPLFSGSMPSGHALAAVSCALILCTVLRQRGISRSILLLISVFAGLVAWARVAVGAHWPSDVIAGVGLAFFVVTLTHFWESKHTWNHWFKSQHGTLLLALIHMLIALHLLSPQSDFFFVYLFQLSLACLSLFKAMSLIKQFLRLRAY